MRYRKRIRICKGVYINLSKSGISSTVGIPGLSLNHSRNGTFVNTGIPGTGIYDRKRVGGSNNNSNTGTKSRTRTQTTTTSSIFNISFEDDGTATITDENHNVVTNRVLYNKVIRSQDYQDLLKKFVNKKLVESANLIDSIVNIHLKTPPLIKNEEFENNLLKLENNLKFPKQYKEEEFPEHEKLQICEEEAKRKISKKVFWTYISRKKDFINSAITKLKEEWETVQEKKRIEFDKKVMVSNTNALEYYNKLLAGDEQSVEEEIARIFSNIKLPVEFNIDFEVNNNKIFLSLDLPEVEDLPATEIQILKSGKFKQKNISKKVIQLNYLHCVTSLALYFSGISFNLSPKITDVIISSYTQKMDDSIGKIYDSYVYSIDINRAIYSNINFTYVDSIESFSNFSGEYHFTKTGLYKELSFDKLIRTS
ncbi:MAG: DUF4236 domain-containing protein [Spirochaetaceae bacterium]|nr:DUF4236 domain-containing protein [Spirochaetaceae bacterium]